MHPKRTLVVIGGGAAGFFAAITAAESNPDLSITILEQGLEVLGKVQCNACLFRCKRISEILSSRSQRITKPVLPV